MTTTTRAAALPHVPALADVVPGYEASAVTGIGAPKETSAEIIATLNTAINAAFADPTMKARLADTGGTMLAGSPAELAGSSYRKRRSGPRWSSLLAPSRTRLTQAAV